MNLVAGQCVGGLRRIPDKVRQADSLKSIAGDDQPVQVRQPGIELRDACNVADFVLWK